MKPHMALIPNRFLVRISHPCRYVADIPAKDGDLIDLPDDCRIENRSELDGGVNFADVRMAWNDGGIGIRATIKGKAQPPVGDPARPRFSDGLSFWLDTRGDRTSHRASRFCHQFHLLPAGGGEERNEPLIVQSKINRAQQDAPLEDASRVPFRSRLLKKGYFVECFLPATVLNGFDPEEHPKLGFYYAIHDHELGEQVLSVSSEFPYSDDPSLWATLKLVR